MSSSEEDLLFEWVLEELSLLEDEFCVIEGTGGGLWSVLERRMREEGRGDEEVYNVLVNGTILKESLLKRLLEKSPPIHRVEALCEGGQQLEAIRCDTDYYWKYIDFPGNARLTGGGALSAPFQAPDSPLQAIMRTVYESHRDCATVEYIFNNGQYASTEVVEQCVALLRPWMVPVPVYYWEDDEGLGKEQLLLLPTRYRLTHTLSLIRADPCCLVYWDEVRGLCDLLSKAPGQVMALRDLKRAYLLQRQRILHPFHHPDDMWARIIRFGVLQGHFEQVVAPYSYRGNANDDIQGWEATYVLRSVALTFEERLVVGSSSSPPPPRPFVGGYIGTLLEQVSSIEPQILSGDWPRRLGLSPEQVLTLARDLEDRERAGRLHGRIYEFASTFLFCGPLFQQETDSAARLEQLLRHRGRPAKVTDIQAFFGKQGHLDRIDRILVRARSTRAARTQFQIMQFGAKCEVIALLHTPKHVCSQYEEELRRARWLELPQVTIEKQQLVQQRDTGAQRRKCDEIFARKHGYLVQLEQRCQYLHHVLHTLDLPATWTSAQLMQELSPSQVGKLVVVGPLSLFPWHAAAHHDVPLRNLRKELAFALRGSSARERAARRQELQQCLAKLVELRLVEEAKNSTYILSPTVELADRILTVSQEDGRREFWAQQKNKSRNWNSPVELPPSTIEALENWAFLHGLHDLDAMANSAHIPIDRLKSWLGNWSGGDDDDDNGDDDNDDDDNDDVGSAKRRASKVVVLSSSDDDADSVVTRKRKTPSRRATHDDYEDSGELGSDLSDLVVSDIEDDDDDDDDDDDAEGFYVPDRSSTQKAKKSNRKPAQPLSFSKRPSTLSRRSPPSPLSDLSALSDSSSGEEFLRKIELEEQQELLGHVLQPSPPSQPPPPRSSKKRAKPSKSSDTNPPSTAKKSSSTTTTTTKKKTGEHQYRRKMNDSVFLNTLHLVVKRHAQASSSGLSLEVDWQAVKDELGLESPRYARELVQFCEQNNYSFREAMCLVRNAKAQDNPILPSSLAKLPDKIRIKPAVPKRLPKDERVFEAIRMFCFTDDANWDEDLWEELRDFVGRTALRRVEAQMHSSNLILRSKGRLRPSTQWLQMLQPLYLDRDLYKNALDWDLCAGQAEGGANPDNNKGMAILVDKKGKLPPHVDDEFMVHAVHHLAAGALTVELEWRENYHHDGKGRGFDRETGVSLKRVEDWSMSANALVHHVKDEVVALRRAPLRAQILAHIRANSEDGSALRVLLCDIGGNSSCLDCVWTLMDLCDGNEVLAVSAEEDVHFVAPEFAAILYHFKGDPLQPLTRFKANATRWSDLLCATLDYVMRYPRITLRQLEEKTHLGCALVWNVISTLIKASVVHFEAFPMEWEPDAHNLVQMELLAEDMAMSSLAKHLAGHPKQ